MTTTQSEQQDRRTAGSDQKTKTTGKADAEGQSAPQSDSAAPASPPAQAEPRRDVDSLVRQLSEQKQVTLRALQATMAIEKQLAEMREDLNRAMMFATIPPDPPRKAEDGSFEPQPEEVLQRTQEELETERRARDDERVTAAAHIARLEDMAATAQEKEKTAMNSLRRVRTRWMLASVAFIGAAILITNVAAKYPGSAVAAALTGRFSSERSQADADSHIASSRDPGVAGRYRDVDNREGRETEDRQRRDSDDRQGRDTEEKAGPLAPQTAIEQAVARMHRALAAYPDFSAHQIIEALRKRQIEIDPTSCLLAWNEGQPELLLQDRGTDRIRIAQTLTSCASAIESAQDRMITHALRQK